MRSELTGINIQYPISRLIVSGDKTVETRTYPIPQRYVGVNLALIETPGKVGYFEARIIGTIKFSRCFRYADAQQFYKDFSRHRVDCDSDWRWRDDKPKWGWEIEGVNMLDVPILAPSNKGIIYTRSITLSP